MNFKKIILTILYFFTSTTVVQAQQSFRTPSNNVSCAVYEKVLRCDLRENTATLPARPKDCELDWGNFFAMKIKGASMRACAGDTVWEAKAPILDYGKTWEQQGFRCLSDTSGLTCTNQDQRGWKLKKSEQKLF